MMRVIGSQKVRVVQSPKQMLRRGRPITINTPKQTIDVNTPKQTIDVNTPKQTIDVNTPKQTIDVNTPKPLQIIIDKGYKYNVLSIIDGIIPSVELTNRTFEYLIKDKSIKHTQILVKNVLADPDSIDYTKYDIVIMIRLCSKAIHEVIIPRIKKTQARIIYFLDDDFTNIDPTTTVGKFYLSMNPKENIEIICKESDAIITFSKKLFEKLLPYNKETHLFHGGFDFELINTLVIPNKVPTNKIIIGYAASGLTHANDFKKAIPALKRILNEYKDTVVLELFFSKIPDELKDCSNILLRPYIPGLIQFYTALSKYSWDIGIAPLDDNVFNHSKGPLKFLEYSAFKIAGVYSKISVFNNDIISGYNGFLANTENEWYDALKLLIENENLRNSIITNANKEASKKYNIADAANEYFNVFKKVTKIINIIAIVDGMMPSVELAIIKPFEYIKKVTRGKVKLSLVTIREVLDNPTLLTNVKYDIAYLLRLIGNSTIEKILPALKKNNIKIIYVMDDDFFMIYKDNAGKAIAGGELYKEAQTNNNMQRICEQADIVLVASKGLLDNYKEYSNKMVQLVGAAHFEFMDTVPRVPKLNDKIIIGWSAADHHIASMTFMIPVFLRLLQTFKDKIIIECFFQKKPKELEKFHNFVCLPGIRSGVYDFYKTLISRNWDIGIAPLVSTPFARAKGAAKYYEYAAANIAGIYSNILAYSQNVVHLKNGLLVNDNNTDWYNAIASLIQNKKLRMDILINADKDIRRYSLEKFSKQYIDIFNNLLG
jgi:glycosyltransferase involved in cell wall biosynthesis